MYTHRTVNDVIIDIRIISENFLQTYSIFTRCEELQICLNITESSMVLYQIKINVPALWTTQKKNNLQC